METKPLHLKEYVRRIRGGREIIYRYHRKTGVRIRSEPGTPAFLAEMAQAGTAAVTERSSHIYFIQAKTLGFIKIGVAVDVHFRMRELATGCPDELELLGYMSGGKTPRRYEKRLHDRFSEHHFRGEWFRPAPAILELIANECSLTG